MLHAIHLKGEQVNEGVSAKIPSGLDVSSMHGSLNEYEAKNLFSAFGIPGVREAVIQATNPNFDAAKDLGEKLVLKILSNDILHKTEIGGVALNVLPSELSATMNAMSVGVKAKAGVTIKQFLVQEMASGGVEFMVGMHRDPLGTAILVGMGGVTAELFKDTHMRLINPGKAFTEQEVLDMLKTLKTWPLLDGYRGKAKCDVSSLVKAIVQFSGMVAALEDRLMECEINPIFVFEDGLGVKAADGITVFN
jgi:succinyl-CoA synthetase beta subunit